jgi:hypothetical protein
MHSFVDSSVVNDTIHRRLKADGTPGAHGLDLVRLLDAVNDAYAELETANARLRDAIPISAPASRSGAPTSA